MTKKLVIEGLPQTGPCGDARLLTITIESGRIDIRNTLATEPGSTNRPIFGYEGVLAEEIERLRTMLCEICATHTDCRACTGILAEKGVANTHECDQPQEVG